MSNYTPDQTIMVRRMTSGEPFTYRELCRLSGLSRDLQIDRVADSLIQKWRKKGWISFVRIGRDTLWSLTESGESEGRS